MQTGDNSESIFQELIKIRKKQLALAAKHIGIETVADDDKSLAPDGRLLDAADKDEIDPLQFARKGQELQDLMASVGVPDITFPCSNLACGLD